MINPCFRKKCRHIMKKVSPVHKIRIYEGKFPPGTPQTKSLFGVEEFCLLCWNALPEKDRFESQIVEPKINHNNYKYLEANKKWNGLGMQ